VKSSSKSILFLLLTSTLALAQSSEPEPDLCGEKVAQVKAEGKVNVTCSTQNQTTGQTAKSQTWFGKALTADFQPFITHGVTAKVSEIRSNATDERVYETALQKYYGVRNVKYYGTVQQPGSDESGATLLQKFATATDTSDSEVSRYVQTTLTAENQYHPTSGASGKCMVWSAWSLDPEVKEMMATVNDGIVCSGVPFTRGELKELITTVYPDPFKNGNIKALNLKGFYDPKHASMDDPARSMTRTPIDIEDANLAMAKLGNFGAGSGFTPGTLVAMAADAKNHHQTLMMDLDPGTMDVWNQPIEAIVDVQFQEPNSSGGAAGVELDSYLSSKDLTAPTSEPGISFYNSIRGAEADIQSGSLMGDHRVSSYLQKLRNQVGEPGNYSGQMTLMEQVTELKRLQARVVTGGSLVASQKNIFKHRIFIQYGKEGQFAANGEVPSQTRQLDYVSVNGRTSWSPPTRKLSAICSDGQVGNRVIAPKDYGLVDNDLAYECRQFAANHVDRDLAIGAFPPKTIDVYTNPGGDARFGPDNAKRQAYNRLRDMILSCNGPNRNGFHTAAVFMDHLKNAISTNALSTRASDPNSVQALKREYDGVKDFLDDASLPANQNFVKSTIIDAANSAGGDPTRFQNLKSLYDSLFTP
jgi:hypothetical protein